MLKFIIKSYTHTQFKLFIAVLSLGLVLSCSPEKTDTPSSILQLGTIKTVKAYGEYFSSEIIKIEDGLVVWESRWDERLVSKQKKYQNIFNVWGREGDSSYFNKFDHGVIDALFPLTVGSEIVFEGLRFSGDMDVGQPFWAKIAVEDTSEYILNNETYGVFIINITVEHQTTAGPKRTTRTLWHASELGINVKTKYLFEGHKYTTRVVKLELPDSMRDERNNVGTTLINFKPENNDQQEIVVLNEAQF